MQYVPLITSLSEIFLKFIVVLFQNIQPSCKQEEEPKTPGMFPVYVYPSPTTPARCHPPPPPALVDAKLDQHNTNQVRTCITYLLLKAFLALVTYITLFLANFQHIPVSVFLSSFEQSLSFSLSLFLSLSRSLSLSLSYLSHSLCLSPSGGKVVVKMLPTNKCIQLFLSLHLPFLLE